VHQELPALDDADRRAAIGQLSEDVAGDQNRLAHPPQLLEKLRCRRRGHVRSNARITSKQSRRAMVAEKRSRSICVSVLFAQVHIDPAGKKSAKFRVHHFDCRIIRRRTRNTGREAH
jgi:hypothetical protein